MPSDPDAPSSPRPPSRRRLVWIGLVLGLMLVAGGLLRPGRAVSVVTVGLETHDVARTLVVVGRVRPLSRTAVGATTVGTVREVPVREGDHVTAGAPLVVLDDREARAALAQARAALTETAATVSANVAQLETETTQAERDLARIRSVFEVGGRTRQQLEQAEQRAADARSRLDAAKATSNGEETASVARARSAVALAEARLALSTLRAPSAGVVLGRAVEPGDAVQPGRTLIELGIEGTSELVVFPSEENLGTLTLGAPARASPDAYPDSVLDAEVSFIAPTVDADQGTVEVRLRIPTPPSYLLPDMTMSVNIDTGRRAGASVLVSDAVRGLGTPEPWVAVVRDGVLVRQPVEVGLRGERYIEIVSGLEASDRVVPETDSPEIGARVRPASR